MALPIPIAPIVPPESSGVGALGARGAAEVLVVGPDAIVAEALALAISSCGLAARVATELPLRAAGEQGGAAVVLPGTGTASHREVAALVGEGRRVAVLAVPSDPGIPAWAEAGAEAVVSPAGDLNTLVTVLAGLSRGEPVASPVPIEDRPRERGALRTEALLLASLTAREAEILTLLAAGRRAAAVARQSYVSLHTVRTQIRSILRKLNVHSQLEAVAIAHRVGWPAARRTD